MKTSTKLFLAVAVGMFALSCVTDATSDLGVKLGGGQVTEFSISLEESRTQLGEEVDGFYPLYWSEGDAISVNGVSSAALTASQAGAAAATFTVEGKTLETYKADVDSDEAFEGDTEVVADGYFHESEYRSAPYFDVDIDGITTK